jgi:acyl dehydratase
MPLNPDAVGATTDPAELSWTSKDCLLYALGVGAGALDPTGVELEFTTENSQNVTQKVLPTFPVIMIPRSGGSGFAKAGTFDPAMELHGEQSVEVHGPVPVDGTVSCVATITGIYDKGSDAVMTIKTVATEVSTRRPLWTTTSALFIRGAGGFGGDRGPSSRIQMPDRAPDHAMTYPTRLDQALLYRLSGDRNPLHSDPSFARLGGFDTPILHGLCTFGFTGRALLHTFCGSDPDRFLSMSGRFSKPVFPGQDLTVTMWEIGDGTALFQTSTPEGVVLDAGRLSYRT